MQGESTVGQIKFISRNHDFQAKLHWTIGMYRNFVFANFFSISQNISTIIIPNKNPISSYCLFCFIGSELGEQSN